ncbi:MAG TPA: AMIN domain-containing protein, partial [Fimbriimonas sp.]|nr:AMIN domain-containing protein [Fimbriimonas sp.]
MNLKLPALVPWMVLAGVAYGQVRTADVLYTFQEATPQPGYRLGDECFVALDTPEQWGWKVKKSSDSVDVTAEGHTVHLTTRYVSGKMVIPLRKVITELGGQTEWTPGADTFNVFSNLTQVTVRNGKVHVQSPLPFKPTAFFLNPGRTVIDLDGARIAPGTEQQVDSGVRIGQFRPNVVRIVIQTDFVPKLPEGKISETKNFD